MKTEEDQLTKKAQIAAASGALFGILDKPVQVSLTCRISKSKFVAGLQCAKRLYLQVHQPQLAKVTDQFNKDQGAAVGVLARNLFRGGVLVDADRNHVAQAVRATRELVNNSEVSAIFEATFRHDGVLVQVDVLRRIGKKPEFQLIEVKSSTDAKPYHLQDLSIQNYVLRGAGVCVNSNHLMRVNPDYVFNGHLELSELFLIEEVPSNRLLTRSAISEILNEQYRMLCRPEPPNIEPGSFCKIPYRCEFFDYCHIAQDQDDLRSLPIPAHKIQTLLHNGLISVSELPNTIHLRLYWHFTNSECSRVDAARRARTSGLSVDPRLRAELASIKYPVAFTDFETLAPAVPRFRGMKPYEPIPIQWSVHLQGHEDGGLEHNEFLAPDGHDPRRLFLESLSGAVGSARSIVVYGSYETTQLANLSRWLPEFASTISSIKSRLVDLQPIIRRNVYSPAFLGSYSIKRVLPVLVRGMNYADLQVQSGDEVGRVWEQSCAVDIGGPEKAGLRQALLDYCARDTLGLAHLVDALRQYADTRKS